MDTPEKFRIHVEHEIKSTISHLITELKRSHSEKSSRDLQELWGENYKDILNARLRNICSHYDIGFETLDKQISQLAAKKKDLNLHFFDAVRTKVIDLVLLALKHSLWVIAVVVLMYLVDLYEISPLKTYPSDYAQMREALIRDEPKLHVDDHEDQAIDSKEKVAVKKEEVRKPSEVIPHNSGTEQIVPAN